MDKSTDRPPLRPEDPRERANQRAAQLLGHMSDVVETPDQFDVPKHLIPDGWTWEWKTWTVYNQENSTEISQLLMAGWEFVEMKPEYRPLVGPDYKESRIYREGQVLMEVPTSVYEEFKARDRRRAGMQVRQKEAQVTQAPVANLPAGFEADNKGRPVGAHGVVGPRSSWVQGVPVPD